MSRRADSKKRDVVFTRDAVVTENRQILIGALITDPDTFAFREDEEYKADSNSIAELAEAIRLEGLLSPLFVKEQGGKFLLLDGHRRYTALLKLVDGGHLTTESPIPAQVLVGEVSKRELLLRIGPLNVGQKRWADAGIFEYAKALEDAGTPKHEIGRVLGKGEKQVTRYLLIANNGWMLKHIRQHHITASRAAVLLALADEHDRKDRFREELDAWVAQTKLDIEEENRRRRDNDQDELTGDKLWPQKRLKPETVESWKIGITTNRWGEPAFKFKALIDTDEDGRRKLEIDGLKTDLDKLPLVNAAKVYSRCIDLADALEPVLLEKKRQEAAAAATTDKDESTVGAVASRRRLAELGIDIEEEQDLDGDDDDDFSNTETREETDFTSTVRLPETPPDMPPGMIDSDDDDSTWDYDESEDDAAGGDAGGTTEDDSVEGDATEGDAAESAAAAGEGEEDPHVNDEGGQG